MDVREKPSLTHEDVISLNFIQSPGQYYFRRHYRMGLRSHIMEVLTPQALALEKNGVLKDGIKHYPRARPSRMLRIFRTRFASLKEAEEEIGRVKIVQQYLSPKFVAQSEEFLVDYKRGERFEILLCGLQTYVEGEILDPWTPAQHHPIEDLLKRMASSPIAGQIEELVATPYQNILTFVARIKKMVQEVRHIPDLAGVGNLLLTAEGDIMLVDINNISPVTFSSDIPIDDRGYPVCDKSVQALFLLEKKVKGHFIAPNEPLYEHFLDPARITEVRRLERKFHMEKSTNFSYRPETQIV
ncbi:MAG: hypothetical protein DRH15_01880 [Deltaproteobacteria bacterium]|nr:MAG: hypothetical protein DRH15_01880 [Deltaproteobacteria bacterium]